MANVTGHLTPPPPQPNVNWLTFSSHIYFMMMFPNVVVVLFDTVVMDEEGDTLVNVP